MEGLRFDRPGPDRNLTAHHSPRAQTCHDAGWLANSIPGRPIERSQNSHRTGSGQHHNPLGAGYV